jgi:hypothetical protein
MSSFSELRQKEISRDAVVKQLFEDIESKCIASEVNAIKLTFDSTILSAKKSFWHLRGVAQEVLNVAHKDQSASKKEAYEAAAQIAEKSGKDVDIDVVFAPYYVASEAAEEIYNAANKKADDIFENSFKEACKVARKEGLCLP